MIVDNDPLDELFNSRVQMRAENRRLRAALQQIAATTYAPRFDAVTAYGIGYQHAIKAMSDIARKALEDQHA